MTKENRMPVKSLLFVILMLFMPALVPVTADAGVTTGKFVVVIDAGHGGPDPGASASYDGHDYVESEITLKIALYTRDYLKKNAKNIDVFLTRTTDTEIDVSKRVDIAAAWNPDLYASLHINAVDGYGAEGCCVLISAGTWREYLKQKEIVFAKYVLEELNALGIVTNTACDQGLMTRLADDAVYPNGQPADHFQNIRNSVLHDFPGVIIEHAFLSNYSEAVTYLRTDAQLRRLAEADAKAIIRYFKDQPAKTYKNGWVMEDGKRHYYVKNTQIKSRLYSIGSELYYFDASGNYATGFRTIRGNTYYFRANGKAFRGLLTLKDGSRYLFHSKTCIMYRNYSRENSNGTVYFFGKNGKMLTNVLVKYKGKLYGLNSKGIFLKNRLQKVKDRYYYFGEDGAAVTGWHFLKGHWSYFHSRTCIQYRNRTMGKYVFDQNGFCINR